MAQAAKQGPDDMMIEFAGDRSRRLSDKILCAFNHAYAVGEFDVAKQLHRALTMNHRRSHRAPDLRDGYDPVGQAELWVAFVRARDRYKEICAERRPATRDAIDALEAMKEAYRRWSFA